VPACGETSWSLSPQARIERYTRDVGRFNVANITMQNHSERMRSLIAYDCY